MSATDYIIDIALIAVVIRQLVPRELTIQSIMIPVLLVAIAGFNYLRGFPTQGNDLELMLVLIGVGAIFGIVSGATTTRVWNNDGRTLAQAGIIAAAVWIIGMGFRLGFDIWAHTKSGEARLFTFSIHHSITGSTAYTTAFVLMAFAQVFLRVGILQYRRVKIGGGMALAAP